MNNNIVKLEPNKIIETQFCFEVECDFCKTTFIIISNNNIRLECCPYCGHDFYKEPERIEYSHGLYGVTKNTIVTPYPIYVSIESINVDNIETNNTYSIECGHCNESYIVDCGEDKEPNFCPHCKTFYDPHKLICKIKTDNVEFHPLDEITYDYDTARFGSFPRITHDAEHHYNTIQEYLSTIAEDFNIW